MLRLNKSHCASKLLVKVDKGPGWTKLMQQLILRNITKIILLQYNFYIFLIEIINNQTLAPNYLFQSVLGTYALKCFTCKILFFHQELKRTCICLWEFPTNERVKMNKYYLKGGTLFHSDNFFKVLLQWTIAWILSSHHEWPLLFLLNCIPNFPIFFGTVSKF